MKKIILLATTLLVLTSQSIFSSAFATETISSSNTKTTTHQTLTKAQYIAAYTKLQKLLKNQSIVDKNIATFDELDYTVFTGQQWQRLHESHAHDIIVHWPDGHTTQGIEKHIEDLKSMFVYAPDTHIKEHPIKIASGNKTAVMGVMEGTFTQPMPLPDGTSIQPTGKKFKINMVTIGIWNKEGVMSEEYLFWDNQTFMKQIGLTQ